MIWVVVESALVCSGTSRSRGRLLAAYMMVYYVGTVLGQLMVSKLPTDLMSVLPWVTGLALAAILPLLFTRIMGQAEEPHETVRIWPMLKLRQARHGVNGCIISGIVLGSLYGLMPLWLNHQGVSDAGIGFWMAVMVSADPRPVAGRAPGRPLRSPAGAAGAGFCGDSGMYGDAQPGGDGAGAVCVGRFGLYPLSGGDGLGL